MFISVASYIRVSGDAKQFFEHHVHANNGDNAAVRVFCLVFLLLKVVGGWETIAHAENVHPV